MIADEHEKAQPFHRRCGMRKNRRISVPSADYMLSTSCLNIIFVKGEFPECLILLSRWNQYVWSGGAAGSDVLSALMEVRELRTPTSSTQGDDRGCRAVIYCRYLLQTWSSQDKRILRPSCITTLSGVSCLIVSRL